MEGGQKKSIDNTSDISSASKPQYAHSQSSSNPTKAETNSDSNTDLSDSSKKQKTTGETTTAHNTFESKSEIKLNDHKSPTHIHYQDISFNDKNMGYCSFSTTNKKSSESISASNTKTEPTQLNPIQKLLTHASTDPDSEEEEEDEQKKKIAAAKKLLFPDPLATSFPEVVGTLRDERRQEFCPIYKDETPEQTALRLSTQKPVGSLLAKRIRWDDLKRKREEEEKKAQMQYCYGPYGPIYNNQQTQQSFANPYEQYYTAMQNQYDLMVKMTHAQQEHSGFWPGHHQQASFQNNDQMAQNSLQQQAQSYTYPYPYMTGINTNLPSTYTPADYNALYSISNMQPPPPPPDEP